MKNHLYETFHEKTHYHKHIIRKKNFTYRILISFLDKYFKPGKNKSVLDIGCGAGTISLYLANKGFHVTGIDVSQRAIKQCKLSAKYLDLDKKTKFITGDISAINLEKKFDYILCSETIEHIKDDQRVCQKISQLLKDRGILILSTPSENAPLHKLGLTRKFDKRVGHLRRYTKDRLKALIKKSDLKIIEIKKTEGILRNALFVSKLNIFVRFIKCVLSDLVTLLDNVLIPIFGESQLFIVAQK